MEDLDSRADEGSVPGALTERLRGIYINGLGRYLTVPLIQIEAADRIEALEKENARLREGLAPAGYVVVPEEPTEKMLGACESVQTIVQFPMTTPYLSNPEQCYHAMIAASQEDA